MKIKSKLLLCFLFVVFLATLLQYLSFIKLKEIAKPLNKGIPANIENLQQISKINSLAQVMRFYNEVITQSARNYVLTQDKKWERRYYEFKPEQEAALESAIIHSKGDEKKIFQKMQEDANALNKKHQSAMQIVKQGGDMQEAVAVLESDEYWRSHGSFWDGLKEFFSRQGANYEGAIEGSQVEQSMVTVKLAALRAQELIEDNLKLVSIFLGAMILISIAVTLIVASTITNPIQLLTKYVERIRQGDLSQKVPIDSKDEVGDLAQAFNQMAEELKNTTVSRDDLAKEIERRKEVQKSLEKQTKEMQEQKVAALNLMDDAEEARMKAEEAEQNIKKAAEELARSNQELEQFAYIASHDLQEPVRKIVGFSQLFEKRFKGKMDKESKEYMDFVIDGAKRMQALIQDLLHFSRIGRAELKPEPVDFNEVLKEVSDNLEVAISENNVKIDYNGLPTLAVHRVQIVQLFQNIITNGIKYRGEADPDITISAQKKEADWEFSISDNGIGIEEEFYDRIFIIFQRLHSKDKYSGTGIGLAMCKKIVERHGGRIWVEPSKKGGSTFKFTLPNIS